jgi:hypothetical protein
MNKWIVRLLAIAVVVLFAPCHAFAQNINGRYVESLDVQVLNAIDALRSESVTVGKLITVMSAPKSGRAIAVLDVEETLKGDSQKIRQIHLPAFGSSREIRKIYAEEKGARLLFIGSTFYVLNEKTPVFRVLGGGTIAGADKVISYIREVIRTHPDWKNNQTARIDGLLVPIDARLEKWAIEAVEKESAEKRRQAVEVLRYFKSDPNIALMKRLLKDPSDDIRKAAAQNLKEWGVAEN